MRLQHGFSLVEVLVTLLVLKVGLLGVLSAQILALKQVQDALQRTQAVALASGLLSDIQSNRQLAAAIGPQFTLTSELPPVSVCNHVVSCTAEQLAVNQLTSWINVQQSAAAAGLIEPTFCVQQTVDAIELRISWLQRAFAADVPAGCQLAAGRGLLQVQGEG